MNGSPERSKRSGIADLLAVFFLPLAGNISASLLLQLVPGAETALRFNALCQGCLLLFAFVWYRQGGGSAAREKRSFPLFEFAGTLILYLLLLFLLLRSGYAASDRNYQTALRSLGGDGERAEDGRGIGIGEREGGDCTLVAAIARAPTIHHPHNGSPPPDPGGHRHAPRNRRRLSR